MSSDNHYDTPTRVTESDFFKLDTKVELLKRDVENVASDVSKMDSKLDSHEDTMREMFEKYVTNDRFEPVRLITYGLVAGVLLTVLGAIMAHVIGGATGVNFSLLP